MSNLLARGVARWQRHYSQGESSEGGFTLVELIVVVVLIPVVLGALAISLTSIFTLQNSTSGDVGLSANGMMASSFFSQDVQSAIEFTTCYNAVSGTAISNSADIGSLQCQTAPVGQQPSSECGTASESDFLFSISPGGQTIISYVAVPLTDPTTQQVVFNIERNVCTGGELTIPKTVNVIAHGVTHQTGITAQVVVCTLGGTPPACPQSGPTTASYPSTGPQWILTGGSSCVVNPDGSTSQLASGMTVTAITGIDLTIAEPANNFASTSPTSLSNTGSEITLTASPLNSGQFMNQTSCQ